MPFKALLHWTGHEKAHPDHVIISGVSEAGARAYALGKNYTEGNGPGQFYIEPCVREDAEKIPPDFSEAPAAPLPPVIDPAVTVTTPLTTDSLSGASGE